MIETPATAKLPARPIRCHQSGDFDDIISDYANRTYDGKSNSESLLSPIANSVITLDSTPERMVDLPGGHNQSRFVVLIEAVEESGTRTERVTFISGYTDHFDYVDAPNGITDVDKDMEIYFNGTVSATRTSRREGGSKISLTDTSQILTSPISSLEDTRSRKQREFHLLTPTAVTHRLSHESMALNLGEQIGTIRDTRTTLGCHGVMRSRRDNNCSSSYMSRILGGYDISRNSSKEGNVDFKMFGEMTALVADSPVQNSAFFKRLLQDSDFVEDGFLTWRSLNSLFPEIRRNKLLDVILQDKDEFTDWRNCDDMGSDLPEALIANMVVSTLPPMFMDLMFDEVDITMTNDTDDGKIMVTIHGYNSFFEGMDFINNLDTLEHRIRFWVLEGQWFTNTLFHITGVVSARGISNVQVGYDDNDPVPYSYASFADASVSPMLSTDDRALEDITSSMSRLIEVIDERFDRHVKRELILPDRIHEERRRSRDTNNEERDEYKPSLLDKLNQLPDAPTRTTSRERDSLSRPTTRSKLRL